MLNEELLFEVILDCVKNDRELPIDIARKLNADEGLFDRFYAYVESKKMTTELNSYVKSRINSRQWGMIKRCTQRKSYIEKGIKVSECFAKRCYKYDKLDYEQDETGRARIFFAVRANFLQKNGEYWIDEEMEIHRIDDNGDYTPWNIVLIPKWLHLMAHEWISLTGNSDTTLFLKVFGYWSMIYEVGDVA